ncbi:21961_t:CDS:2, partial [Dentiscutata erythropus]
VIESPSSPMSIAVSEDVTNEDELSSDDEPEVIVDYKLFIKMADGVSLPAKWFKESVDTVDEFLSSIHRKVLLMTKDTILPNDYRVTFKTQREAGAGTQLADAQDFIKFKSECTKLAERDPEDNVGDYKNNNQVPSISSLSPCDKEVAKNALEIRQRNGLATIKDLPTHQLFSHNNISSKKLRTSLQTQQSSPHASPRIQLLQSSSQATLQLLPQVLPQMQLPQSQVLQAQPQLFLSSSPSLQAPLLSPQQYNWAFGSQMFQPHQPLLTIPYNPYQTLSYTTQPQPMQYNSNISSTFPTMSEFLKEVDEKEKTGTYYQNFLGDFESQRILVKHLRRLTDEQFDKCKVTTIGTQQTLREYAERYYSF